MLRLTFPSRPDARIHPVWLVAPATLLLVLVGGLAAPVQPLLLLPMIALAALLTLTTLQDRSETLFLGSLGVLILGYLFMGKGFAYVGAPPLYVGELVFLLGMAAVVIGRVRIQLTAIEVILILFMLFGVMRTIPYIPVDGVTAIRDAALWYYAIYALLVSWFITERRLRAAISGVSRVLPILLIWLALMPFTIGAMPPLPSFPGAPEPIISVTKPGDRAVILVALAAFIISGLYARRAGRWQMTGTMFWSLWLGTALVIAATNRGGMLSIWVGLGFLMALKPSREWLRPMGLGVLALAILLIWNPSIETGTYRTMSAQQLVINVTSIFSDDTENAQGVQGTKQWRLQWWGDIIDDTTTGPDAWTGKGFGLNLANAYGYQTVKTDALRSPHNIHMTVLARMGVPGLALWAALHVTFANQMIRAYRTSRDRGDRFWMGVYAWILPIWLAALVRASFDVYLEGPQGAIPFWCIFGLGLGALRIQQHARPPDPIGVPSREGGDDAYPAGA